VPPGFAPGSDGPRWLLEVDAWVDISQLSSSCADLDELERRAATVDQLGPGQYRRLKAARSARELSVVRPQLQKALTTQYELANLTTPDDLQQEIASDKALADRIRCLDAHIAAEIDAWSTHMTSAIADEKSCRAKPTCMGARIAPGLCDVVALQRQNPFPPSYPTLRNFASPSVSFHRGG
jgi:hypothetical protein